MNLAATAREKGLWKRGVLWLLLLGPLFFASYGFATWFTAQRSDVGIFVFAWERGVPLWPWTIVPYWSIDLLYGLSFLLPLTRREMDRHALRLLSAQIICVSCFLLWPLRFSFERPPLEGIFGLMFDVLMGFDKPFNQAPSLHITLLVIIWAMFARHTSGSIAKPAMHLWMALIGLSVLTTWQHHFIDVPTGALAGLLCLWLWPMEEQGPLHSLHLARNPKRWRLALCYSLGVLLCSALAINLGGAALWLLWPAVSLLLVALNYAVLGPRGFQKRADGNLSPAATWLLAPYLLGAWVNSRLWTRSHPQADEIVPGIWLGRLPSHSDSSAYAALVDLCAELPVHIDDQGYCSIPVLDLTVPDSEACQRAAEAIEAARTKGPVLVFCALGYSRSATAIAAWLLRYGHCHNCEEAEALIRRARPSIVLSEAHRRSLSITLEVAHDH